MSCRVASWVTSSEAGSPLVCSRMNTIVMTPSIAVAENASRRTRYSLTVRDPALATTPADPAGCSAAPRRVEHRQFEIRPGRPLQVAAHAVGVRRAEQRDGGRLLLVH